MSNTRSRQGREQVPPFWTGGCGCREGWSDHPKKTNNIRWDFCQRQKEVAIVLLARRGEIHSSLMLTQNWKLWQLLAANIRDLVSEFLVYLFPCSHLTKIECDHSLPPRHLFLFSIIIIPLPRTDFSKNFLQLSSSSNQLRLKQCISPLFPSAIKNREVSDLLLEADWSTIMSGPPIPTGPFSEEYLAEDQSGKLIVVATTFAVLETLFVSLFVLARVKKGTARAWDVYLMIPAFLCCFSLTVLAIRKPWSLHMMARSTLT